MNDYLLERIKKEAEYIIKNKSTVRKCAKAFGVSKSTVHLDMVKKLQQVDKQKFIEVHKIFDYNYKIKHIRGGESVRQKSKLKKETEQ